MKINDDEAIKKILESQYINVLPPQHLKTSIMRTIELVKIFEELCSLYTKGILYLFRQWKIEGGKS